MRIVSPLILLVTILLIDIILHTIFGTWFGYIIVDVILIVVLYLFSFLIGFHFISNIIPNLKKREYKITGVRINKLYIYTALIFALSLYAKIIIENSVSDFSSYRQLIFSFYENKNTGYWLLRFLTLYVFYAILSLIFFRTNFYENLILFFIVLLISIISTGRNYLLIYLLSLSIVVINSRRPFLKLLLTFFLFFITSAFYVLAFNKAEGNLISSTFKSILDYFSLPLYGLSYMIEENKYYGDVQLLSPAILNVFGLSKTSMSEMPYTSEPFVTNVYTLFYPIYYDLGLHGIFIFGITYGVIHKKIYLYAQREQPFALYVYCLSLYPLIMTIFYDVYISSLGLWVAALIPWLLLKKGYKN